MFGDGFYRNAFADVEGSVRFGRNVLLGPKLVIWDRCDPAGAVERGARSPVWIGEGVRMAASSIVWGSVTIGSGSVVGAGSGVPANLAPGSVAVGNPTRVLRQR